MFDQLSRFLATLVVVVATSYVVAEQPWCQSALAAFNLPTPHIGVIRCPLSRHR
jgi:hypothetical protein